MYGWEKTLFFLFFECRLQILHFIAQCQPKMATRAKTNARKQVKKCVFFFQVKMNGHEKEEDDELFSEHEESEIFFQIVSQNVRDF